MSKQKPRIFVYKGFVSSFSMKFKKIYPIMFFTQFSTYGAFVAVQTFRATFSMIFMAMFSVVSYKKIFNSIVEFIFVYMMYLLFWLKISTDLILHHQSVFKNISVSFCKRVINSSYHTISVMKRNATLPSRVIFSSARVFNIAFSAFSNFVTSFLISRTTKKTLFTADCTVFANHYITNYNRLFV